MTDVTCALCPAVALALPFGTYHTCRILPTVFLPLRLLSLTSLISVLSTFVLIFSVIADSLIKPSAPGSLWDPMPTTWGVSNWEKVPLSFGLLMSGFAGHAVLPSLARDMAEPKDFDRMVDTAYVSDCCGFLFFSVCLLFLPRRSLGCLGHSLISDES